MNDRFYSSHYIAAYKFLYLKYAVNCFYFAGYAPLHFASCWGHRSCLETLVQNGINLDLRTNYGESSRQLAVRYKHSDCIEYIDWASMFDVRMCAGCVCVCVWGGFYWRFVF